MIQQPERSARLVKREFRGTLGSATDLPSPSAAWEDYAGLVSSSAKPLALVVARGEPRFLAASPGFIDSLQASPAAIIGCPIDDVLGPKNGPASLAACRSCLIAAETVPLRVAIEGRSDLGLITFAVRPAGSLDGDHVVFKVTDVRRGPPVWSGHGILGDGRGPSLTYINDLESGHVRYADDGLAGVLGLKADGLLSIQEIRAQVHPDDQAKFDAYEAVRSDLRDGVFIGAAFRLRDTAGSWRLINFRARVLQRDHGGGVRAMLGSATDITDAASAAAEALGVSVQRAEENERARIGRELHDSVSQYLIGADLGVSSLLRAYELPRETRKRLHDVQASLASAHQEMRALAFLLHPPELDELGLSKSLDRFCAGFAHRTGLAIDFILGRLPGGLSSAAEHALFRVCQEALMNVHVHAFARCVTVRIGMRRQNLLLEVQDDGIGVEAPARLEQDGVGLASMRARMAEVGGELTFDLTGPGLTVVARIPMR